MAFNNHPEFEMRQSQLLAPFGVGALLDINNQSVMMADTEYWNKDELAEIHDIRLEKVLEVDGFVEPPLKMEYGKSSKVYGKRFPEWYFSPETRELKKIDEWHSMIRKGGKNIYYLEEKFKTTPFTYSKYNKKRRIELVPVRILCACTHGHIQDFPWVEWVHQDTNLPYDVIKHHPLKLTSSGKSTALSELRVQCTACNTSHSLGSVLNTEYMEKIAEKIGFRCQGRYIWKKAESPKVCKDIPQVLFRNATGLYFPKIVSSVIIPFNENSLLEKILPLHYYGIIKDVMNSADEDLRCEIFQNDEEIAFAIRGIAAKLNVENDKVRNVLAEKFGLMDQHNEEPIGMMDYRQDEYAILTGRESYNAESEIDFEIKIISKDKLMQESSAIASLFKKITLVNSLEVLSALTGYTRINSMDTEELVESLETQPEHIVSLRRKDNRFLGLKAKGEGIFIELDPTQVNEWSERISGSKIEKDIHHKQKKDSTEAGSKLIEPEYYLVHTLAHLLIRELTLNSGYSSSSIRERIYFSNDEDEMYGLLLYTSSSDSEGTLGGLVKQGIPKNLFRLMESALQKSKWCSFDPVCIESAGQGRDAMNLAACHACSLVSETSCEKMNSLLDRKTLIGTWENPELGFFSAVL